MKAKALTSKYKKTRDLIDYDYTRRLSAEERAFLEAFTASYYNGSPSDESGSVPAAESYELNSKRRRDMFAAGTRTDRHLGDVTEVQPYKSAFADGRKNYRRAMARKRRAA